MKTSLYKIDEKSNTKTHGENKRQIAFIVLKEHYEDHHELLHKIIAAVGLNVNTDIRIIEMLDSSGRLTLNELYRESISKHFFVFGLNQSQLGIQSEIQPHQPKVSENYVLHLSYGLDQLSSNQELKKQLWGYLKKIFK